MICPKMISLSGFYALSMENEQHFKNFSCQSYEKMIHVYHYIFCPLFIRYFNIVIIMRLVPKTSHIIKIPTSFLNEKMVRIYF